MVQPSSLRRLGSLPLPLPLQWLPPLPFPPPPPPPLPPPGRESGSVSCMSVIASGSASALFFCAAAAACPSSHERRKSCQLCWSSHGLTKSWRATPGPALPELAPWPTSPACAPWRMKSWKLGPCPPSPTCAPRRSFHTWPGTWPGASSPEAGDVGWSKFASDRGLGCSQGSWPLPLPASSVTWAVWPGTAAPGLS